MVLRKIFMLKRDEVTVDWRKLQSEDPDGLYFSSSIIRLIKSRIETDGVCGTWRGAYGVLVGKPERKRPLRRRRRKWEDNIKVDRKEIGWEAVNRIDLAQDVDKSQAAVNAIMNHRVLKIARDFLNA